MLLNKMCGRRLSAISLCLAVTFAPLFNAQADEPEMIPGDSSASVSEQPTALSQPQVQSSATAIMAGFNRYRRACQLIKPAPNYNLNFQRASRQCI